MNRLTLSLSLSLLGLALGAVPASADLFAAVLPSSRAVSVGTAATVFATIINAGGSTATGCSIAPINAPVTFSYQTTSSATNQPTGSPNQPVDIPAGQSQSFVLSLTPTAPISSNDTTTFNFDCGNTAPAANAPGVNTLALFACSGVTTDVISIGATQTNDGIVHIPGPSGLAAFGVAATNIGASASNAACGAVTNFGTFTGTFFSVRADTEADVIATICQTNSSAACLAPPSGSVLVPGLGQGVPMTFSIFVQGEGTNVPFDPANNRVAVSFTEVQRIELGPSVFFIPVDGVRGATSVAVQTN